VKQRFFELVVGSIVPVECEIRQVFLSGKMDVLSLQLDKKNTRIGPTNHHRKIFSVDSTELSINEGNLTVGPAIFARKHEDRSVGFIV
jgi:hypothetical protein